jgi:hypothetical protein
MFAQGKDWAMAEDALHAIFDGAQGNPKKLKKLQEALRRPERFASRIGKVLASAASKTAPGIFRKLKADGPAMLLERHATFAGFEKRLYRTWKRPLDLLEMLIVVCAEAGEGLSAQWPWKEDKERDLVFNVVRRLQARACQVAYEVLTLLKAGYAPAAHARWRTLHETAVTASFIVKYGKVAAELYLDHEHVEARKAARLYQRYCRRLGYTRYSRNEMAGFRRRYNIRLKKHGPLFKNEYGWAAVVLGRKRVTFADLEKVTKLDHLRPFYKMASYPVHATVKSIRFSVALAPGEDILLTGPSNLGLADPGHSTAISLGQCTTTLLFLLPSVDSIAVMRVVLLFTAEIGNAFLKADDQLKAKGRRRSSRGARKK